LVEGEGGGSTFGLGYGVEKLDRPKWKMYHDGKRLSNHLGELGYGSARRFWGGVGNGMHRKEKSKRGRGVGIDMYPAIFNMKRGGQGIPLKGKGERRKIHIAGQDGPI